VGFVTVAERAGDFILEVSLSTRSKGIHGSDNFVKETF
jgi:hypothetical protein